ncbi:FAD/NAD(P)-binding protein [Hydrogenophaga sp. BPS33]|uniref:FAD/NAD(P)-binding protein n=1 Tax=Hydrogenophaga sp. BPS33 TaxID=2651974 RepID=UPI00131FDCB5|nr:FAD/NAD(P)-binding protein [Hydrogenophaga sp. BPS33]QHE86052.1 NAD(P)-binding protein [Hydrogenophaga sp. BPS33]
MTDRRVVVIVGGGFSGAACAIHLSQRSQEPLDIRIVEPSAALGMGIAHAAVDPDLRLNGPAHIHSPYPDAPGDFADWMARTGEAALDPQATAASGLVFARRGAFGRYMAAEVARHARSNPSGSAIDHVQQQALRASPGAAHVEVGLHGGQRIRADHCILALGWNAVGTPRELSAISDHPGWFGNPWATHRFDAIGSGASVLLIGSGLTASDTFAVLAAKGHQGPVLALSRRGLRPASQNPHRSTRSMWERVFEQDPPLLREAGHALSMRQTVALLRRKIAEVDEATSSWHVPFDEFRDAAWILWNQWSPAEQRQYQRHVKSWYDSFRFRNPPQTEAIARAGVERGQLGFAAGRLRGAHRRGHGLHVSYASRERGECQTLHVDAIINCTGPQPRPSASQNPFWQALIADGVGRDAPGGAGIDVDMGGRLLDAHGRVHDRLFAIGPPTNGRFAEAIAVPYIVRGILDVARHALPHAHSEPTVLQGST